MSEDCVVPDTSVIVDGRITEKVRGGEYRGKVILIAEAVVSELESQANRGRETGLRGLEELKELNELSQQGEITLKYVGERPSLEQIKLASSGEIDAIIRSVAMEYGAVFVTSDQVQAEVARAKGLKVKYLSPLEEEPGRLSIEDFFTEDTLSVHLIEGTPPLAKRGRIGEEKLVKIREEECSSEELRSIAKELVERARRVGLVEMECRGAAVLQIGVMRVAIAHHPFSARWEITAVRPVATARLEDYRFSEELKKRLLEHRRGILVAGPPGAGKSTFAAGIAEFLLQNNFIVKTLESPRDLQVDPAITQYGPLEGDMEKTADLLLLVRPDYTIYDEVRKTRDFKVFADLRLAGVGMVGIVHATRPVDAIQRLLTRVELGMVSQVVDTVVFIEKGKVTGMHDIIFTVKVPQGMTEEDLARPVIQMVDFETRTPEYEIYTYGEQVIVMPVKEVKPPGSWGLASREIQREIEKYTPGPVKVEMVSDSSAKVYLPPEDISTVLGRKGGNIDRIEKRLGIHLDIHSLEDTGKPENLEEDTEKVHIRKTRKHLVLQSPLKNRAVEVLVGGERLLTATTGRKGDIRLPRDSEEAFKILENPGAVRLRILT